MQACVQRIIGVATAALWLSPALAFGPMGHDLVGDIAELHLCGEARASVRELLGGDSLAYAGRWPDWIRRTSEWAHTAPWHYINVEDSERVARVTGLPQGDVVEATQRALRQVADPRLPKAERGRSLRFAAHFLADIHQPLHVGRAGDRGGNSIDVRLGGKQTNLHALWDAQYLLRSYGLKRRALTGLINSQLTGREQRWGSGNPVSWAQESFALRPLVYAPVRGTGLTLQKTDRYLRTARDVVSERLAQAGIRLAVSLNNIFCNSS